MTKTVRNRLIAKLKAEVWHVGLELGNGWTIGVVFGAALSLYRFGLPRWNMAFASSLKFCPGDLVGGAGDTPL